ncbi:histonelysine Nmethyltransferase SETMARlike [Trichonephila clavipes]|nr:histonelysine Nmethyltransferase SETMARlike [Trichonephila clavipes]
MVFVYGADSVTANYAQFWFRRFRSGIFDVKDAPRTGGPIVENVDKITEIIEFDRHVSRSIAQKLKINHKTVLSHLRKVGFKKKLHDDAKPHTSVVTLQNIWELGWEVLMHPPYCLNLAPSDYYLFLAGQNFISDKKLGSRVDCENRLLDVFAHKDQDFYERGRPELKRRMRTGVFAVTAKRNRRSTASDLSRQLSSATGTIVSRQTVYRRLGHVGLYARRPVRCVPLTATHCHLRLTWSRKHAL